LKNGIDAAAVATARRDGLFEEKALAVAPALLDKPLDGRLNLVKDVERVPRPEF